LRPATASLQSFDFAMELVQWNRWDALRSWSAFAYKRDPPQKELVAYIAGRERLASRRYVEAREAFSHTEEKASLIVAALQRINPVAGQDSVVLPAVAFCEHVAGLFRDYSQLEDEYIWLCKAAILAEAAADGTVPLRQRLWSAVFERALGLQKWDEAFDALLRIDAVESYLRMLSHRLRSCGRIELMLKLPEPHRTYFLSNLHEHASMGTPTAGSDSLACYQHLYALYFSEQAYLKAASVAHSLYAALGSSLRHFVAGSSSEKVASSGEALLAGDCLSKAGDVPAARAGPAREAVGKPWAQVLEQVWPLLEQQRSALLMLISALALTPEKMLLAPPSKALCGEPLPSQDMAGLQSWFLEASSTTPDMAISLADARRLLAIVEAEMVLSGRELPDPAGTSEAVAELGLLRLAVQVSSACGLDLWQCAFKPFVRLCVEAEAAPDEKVEAIAAAARGPAMAYMFTHSDGASPLGSGGSVRRAWWQTLEDTLKEVTSRGSNSFLNAAGTRLFSLVADEILGSETRLPHFLAKALSRSPSWVTLLRLYMKHRMLQESVELLSEQLNHRKLQVDYGSWSPLADFPVTLTVQLLRAVQKRAKEELPGGPAAALATTLADVLRQFQVLLEDFERNSGS